MRWSNLYLFTTREVPNDAEVVSHRLMIRAGMIKKLAAGIYSTLPFGLRSVAKLEAIVRREMDRSGACELSMPTIQPAELWQATGRWQVYGKELLRVNDRNERPFVYAPTAEEVVTDIVRRDVRSYKQLPFNLYQIQTKFRDEVRPRFGLMRGREFSMKDAYSFHATGESLHETYLAMRDAYRRIFEACQLGYTMVEADSGAIGGTGSHEFMVIAQTGEAEIVSCTCGYAANTEKATTGELEGPAPGGDEPYGRVATPGKKTIAEVSEFLGLEPWQLVKTLIYTSEKEELVAVMIRGDREVNEVKLANHLNVLHLQLATDDDVTRATGAPVGYAGPVNLAPGVRRLTDPSAARMVGFACGAGEADAHFVNVHWGRDAQQGTVIDLDLAQEGDPCPKCGLPLKKSRGIEVGHIFKLGTKYSEKLECNFLDAEGNDKPMIMGCYGLGIGRTVAAAIEQNHDEAGIIWPWPLAPYSVLLIALNPQDEEVCREADKLYAELTGQGFDVLYDDRNERPGVKFNDADLIGIPLRLVVGKKGLEQGKIELSLRRDREKHLVDLADVRAKVAELVQV
jgi:prolyl-tRNA synthetase